MKIALLIFSAFIFSNSFSQKVIDTSRSRIGLLPVSTLLSVFELSKKDQSGISEILNDTNWKFSGKDERELVFSIKTPVKGLLSWHFKENYLVYFFFRRDYFNELEKKLVNDGYTRIENNQETPNLKMTMYKRDGMLVKLSEVITHESIDNFFILLQKEPGSER